MKIMKSLSFWLLTAMVFTANSNMNAQKKMIEELKIFVFCDCVNENYRSIDSTFQSDDVTNSYIFQYTAPISIYQYEKLMSFIREETSTISKEHPYGTYDAPNSNMTFYFCKEFSESKKLKKFLVTLLKEKE